MVEKKVKTGYLTPNDKLNPRFGIENDKKRVVETREGEAAGKKSELDKYSYQFYDIVNCSEFFFFSNCNEFQLSYVRVCTVRFVSTSRMYMGLS